MICPPCRYGGTILAILGPEESAKVHAKCKDPLTCPCHHSVDPNAVNRSAIELSSRGKIDTRINIT